MSPTTAPPRPQARPAPPASAANRSQRPPEAPSLTINVGETERWLSLLGGGTLALLGLTRGSIPGLGMGLLGCAFAYRGATGHCPCYSALGLNTAQQSGETVRIPAGHGVKVEHSVSILKPADELYRHWRNFENLPRFMQHLESVKTTGNRSHWLARGPLGVQMSWDAELIEDRPGEVISWRSVQGSTVDVAGSVHFTPAPANRGTVVKVTLKYDPPAGQVGAAVARMLGAAPEQEIREDLRRFKRFMETGEVPTTEGQPSGRGREVGESTGEQVVQRRITQGLTYLGVGVGLAVLGVVALEVLSPRSVLSANGRHS
jgi:uncharacterized membrane protein